MKIIIIGPLVETLINLRGELIRSFANAGHDVVAVSASGQEHLVPKLEALGCRFEPVSYSRNSLNPFGDLKYLLFLRALFLKEQPDKIFAYTIKAVVWGGLAARMIGFKQFYALIPGLGYVFHGVGLKPKLLAALLTKLYRVSQKNTAAMIFQNEEDKQLLLDKKIIPASKAHRVYGSGVDLAHFAFSSVPLNPPVFLLIGRLIEEKGHREFYQAAKQIKKVYPAAEFHILGPQGVHSNAVSLAEIDTWQDEGVVRYLGETQDVRPFIEACSVFVLPSYYGEGLPRSNLEAMSIGRPLITTDNVGCRDTVVDQKNGLLIEKQNIDALVNAMQWMLEHQGEWQTMADNGRAMVEEKFDVHKVNQDIFQIMGL